MEKMPVEKMDILHIYLPTSEGEQLRPGMKGGSDDPLPPFKTGYPGTFLQIPRESVKYKTMEKYFDINKPGHSIKCKLYCEKIRELEHVTVFLHGFGGSKENKTAAHFADAAMSKSKNMAVLAFDWPCHGNDVKKKLTLDDCSIYLDHVLGYVRDELHVSDICAYGTSFGACMVLNYIYENGNPFRKIALRNPAVDIYEAMSERMMTEENKKLLERGKEALAGFDRLIRVDSSFLDELREKDVRKMEFYDYAEDIFVVQGTKDEVVGREEVVKFCEDNVIEYALIEGADHRFQDLQKLKLAHSYIIRFFAL